MPAKTSKLTDDPWAAMDAIIQFIPEPLGAEWFTPQQFATRYSLSHSQGVKRLKDLSNEGKLDHWRGGSVASGGRITNKYRAKT